MLCCPYGALENQSHARKSGVPHQKLESSVWSWEVFKSFVSLDFLVEVAASLWTPNILHLKGFVVHFLFATLPQWALSLPIFYFYVLSTSTPLSCSWFPREIPFFWAARGLCFHAAVWFCQVHPAFCLLCSKA